MALNLAVPCKADVESFCRNMAVARYFAGRFREKNGFLVPKERAEKMSALPGYRNDISKKQTSLDVLEVVGYDHGRLHQNRAGPGNDLCINGK